MVDFSDLIHHDIDEEYLNYLLFLTDSAVCPADIYVVESKIRSAFGYDKNVVEKITCILFGPELF